MIPFGVALRCFLRSLLFQASWSVRGGQNVGFAYAMWPAIAHLYPGEDARREAGLRQLAPFNTHPYLAAGILGGAIHLERLVARGELDADEVESFRQALAGPFAAMGDSFFWGGLRPAAAATILALLPFLGLWSLVVGVVGYNVIHLGVRVSLFRHGLRGGPRVLDAAGALHLSARASLVKKHAISWASFALVVALGSQSQKLGYTGPVVPALAAVGAAALIPLIRRGQSPYLIAGVTVGISVLAGILSASGLP